MEQQQQGLQRTAAGQAIIRYSVWNQPGPYVGKTVADVRAELGPLWSIPADAQAFKGKEQLDSTYIIQPNDQIEFHRKLGEKG